MDVSGGRCSVNEQVHEMNKVGKWRWTFGRRFVWPRHWLAQPGESGQTNEMIGKGQRRRRRGG